MTLSWPAAADRGELIVIGGGIQGCCAALEAARRGVPTTLVERGAIGRGTSDNTLRILHGGLRYLQQLDVARMRRSHAEREWFRRWFPDLVEPLPCIVPLYGRGLLRPSLFAAALRAEGLLRRDDRDGAGALSPGRLLSAGETAGLVGAADRAGLQGGGLWFDAVMPEPRALLAEIVRWGVACGLTVLEGVDAEAVLLAGTGRLAGVRCREVATGVAFDLRAPRVLNCAGPAARELARRFDNDVPALFEPSLAFNLVLACPPPAAAALALAGGRGATRFLVPAREGTLAGTWHAGCPAEAVGSAPSPAQVDAALAELQAALPRWALRRADVVGVLAGNLPALRRGSSRPRRDDVLHDHGARGGPRGLVSVSGVKFTTARALALRALAAVGLTMAGAGTPRPPRVVASAELSPPAIAS